MSQGAPPCGCLKLACSLLDFVTRSRRRGRGFDPCFVHSFFVSFVILDLQGLCVCVFVTNLTDEVEKEEDVLLMADSFSGGCGLHEQQLKLLYLVLDLANSGSYPVHIDIQVFAYSFHLPHKKRHSNGFVLALDSQLSQRMLHSSLAHSTVRFRASSKCSTCQVFLPHHAPLPTQQ